MITCTLTQSESYTEVLSVTPVEALPGSFELLIRSNLSNAKDPTAWQVRHRVIVSANALAAVGRALCQAGESSPPEGSTASSPDSEHA